MQSYQLKLSDGHLFMGIGGAEWLLDTGAPSSFGDMPAITVDGMKSEVASSYMGLTAAEVSRFVGQATAGIIGADVLNAFDAIIDAPGGRVTFSRDGLACDGTAIELDEFMGIPIIVAVIGDSPRRMFFDSGAQISYFQDDSLSTFPTAGTVTDFYPGAGQFQTDTHWVDMMIGTGAHRLRCGKLPALLGMTLMMADTEGILGNEICRSRIVGFLPRRKQVVLG